MRNPGNNNKKNNKTREEGAPLGQCFTLVYLNIFADQGLDCIRYSEFGCSDPEYGSSGHDH